MMVMRRAFQIRNPKFAIRNPSWPCDVKQHVRLISESSGFNSWHGYQIKKKRYLLVCMREHGVNWQHVGFQTRSSEFKS